MYLINKPPETIFIQFQQHTTSPAHVKTLTKPITAFNSIIHVPSPIILWHVSKCGIDAPLEKSTSNTLESHANDNCWSPQIRDKYGAPNKHRYKQANGGEPLSLSYWHEYNTLTCAATVWDLVGKSFVIQAVLNPPSDKPMAALRPAPPAPTTMASYVWSTIGYDDKFPACTVNRNHQFAS